MNIIKIAALVLLLPLQVNAEDITLGSIDVTLDVITQPKIEVKTPKSIELKNSVKNNMLFEASTSVKVTLFNQEKFQVSIKNPLVLAHDDNSKFQSANVSWGTNLYNLKQLSIQPTEFSVISARPQTGTDYILHISAIAPQGLTTTGDYHGQLTLLFETNS